MQKINKRLNIIDRSKISKNEGVRLVDRNNTIVVDWAQNLGGKGVYLSSDENDFEKINENILSRAFRRKVSKEEAEKLRKELKLYGK